jgi:hypothetical protein
MVSRLGKKPTESYMGMLSLSEGFVSVMNKDIQVGTFVIDILSYLQILKDARKTI